MSSRTKLLSLEHNKHDGANHRDKVEGQIDEIPNNRLRSESLERQLEHLAQFRNWISSWFYLAAFCDKVGCIS